VIDQMPPGRQTIKTYCKDSSYRPRVHAFIQKEIDRGRQAYVICPAIEESPTAELNSVVQYTSALQEALPTASIAALHGKMGASEKQGVMDAFKEGRIQVIVATTVIEVGIHVANATLMVVENADRFGLSQLHQLRGRVGRGAEQSFCILITDTKNELTLKRMQALTQTSDGFLLSELDLQLRGPGDFFGAEQHGLPSFSIANLYRDMEILKEAQSAATEVFRNQDALPPEDARLYTRRLDELFCEPEGTAL